MAEQHNMEARLADALRDVLGAVAKIGRLPQTVMRAERDMDVIRAAGQKARNVLSAYEADQSTGQTEKKNG
jgi:hypothetical protein